MNARVEVNPILNEVMYISSPYETILRNMGFYFCCWPGMKDQIRNSE